MQITETEIILKYKNMVYKLAHKYKHLTKLLTVEDLAQEGYIGLLEAIRTYNADSKAAETTYYYNCIKYKILRAIRDVNKSHKTKRIITSYNTKTDKETELLDFLVDLNNQTEPETMDKLEANFILEEFKRVLDPDLQKIAELTYRDKTSREIAKELGLDINHTMYARKVIRKQLVTKSKYIRAIKLAHDRDHLRTLRELEKVNPSKYYIRDYAKEIELIEIELNNLKY